MDHFSKIKIILILIYSAVTISGCRCNDEVEITPMPEEKSCYLYWPIDSNKKWVFEVLDNNLNPVQYLYDDTLEFVRDSNILKNGELYFHVFGFKKKNNMEEFVMGNYMDNLGKLYLLMDRVNYTLFDVNLLTDKPPGATYKSDGKPIDVRYEMSYINLIGTINTNIGNIRSIVSYYTFVQNYSTGFEARDVAFSFGENIGPVQISYKYKLKGIPDIPDSTVSLLYKIKKIIN